MSKAQEILDVFAETGKATRATAQRVGVSERYVRRVVAKHGAGGAASERQAEVKAALVAALANVGPVPTRAVSVAAMVIECDGDMREASRRLGVSRQYVYATVDRVLGK